VFELVTYNGKSKKCNLKTEIIRVVRSSGVAVISLKLTGLLLKKH